MTIYQMLTGALPYDTPTPSDLERLRRGDLVSPPRLRNPAIPKVIEDIVMRALAADIGSRYQRSEDLLHDLLAARREVIRRPAEPVAVAAPSRVQTPTPPRRPAAAMRTREVSGSRFCWNCRKPLPARGSRCPFCDESQ